MTPSLISALPLGQIPRTWSHRPPALATIGVLVAYSRNADTTTTLPSIISWAPRLRCPRGKYPQAGSAAAHIWKPWWTDGTSPQIRPVDCNLAAAVWVLSMRSRPRESPSCRRLHRNRPVVLTRFTACSNGFFAVRGYAYAVTAVPALRRRNSPCEHHPNQQLQFFMFPSG